MKQVTDFDQKRNVWIEDKYRDGISFRHGLTSDDFYRVQKAIHDLNIDAKVNTFYMSFHSEADISLALIKHPGLFEIEPGRASDLNVGGE